MATKAKESPRSSAPLSGLTYFSIGTAILTALIVVFAQRRLPPQLPLYYGLAEGEDQLTSPLGLFIPSVVAFSVGLVNLFIARALEDEYLQQVLVVSSFVVSIFAIITTAKIIFLVGSF